MATPADALQTDRVYHEREDQLDPSLLRDAARLTGQRGTDPALAVAFVLALRTLIGSELLPDGAIMLGHEATWFGPPPAGARVRTSLRITETTRRGDGDYTKVVVGYGTAAVDGEPLIDQRQEVLWPTTD